MSVDLNIIANLTCEVNGVTVTDHQGEVTDLFNDAFALAITGVYFQRQGTIADATVTTIYVAANELPATSKYIQIWTDDDIYVQVIGSATHAIFKTIGMVPFTIPNGAVLGVASTTVIAAEPTTTAIAKIVLGNYSGGTVNWRMSMFL